MKTIYLLTIIILLTSVKSYSQTTYKYLHIGDKQIKVQLTRSITVWETSSDSLVYQPKQVKFPFVDGNNTLRRTIEANQYKPYKREFIVEDNGMVYQRITTQVKHNEYEPNIFVNTVNDSAVRVITPFVRHDTVMQINPITLEEQMVVSVDSISRAMYDLGAISKAQLKADIGNKFGHELEVTGLQMLCITDSSYWQEYYYHKLQRLEATNYYPTPETVLNAPNADGLYAKIDKLKNGDKIILYIELKVDGHYKMLYDLAVVTIKD